MISYCQRRSLAKELPATVPDLYFCSKQKEYSRRAGREMNFVSRGRLPSNEGSLEPAKKQEAEHNRERVAKTLPLKSLNQWGRISMLKYFIGLTDSSEYYRRILVRIFIWVPPETEFMIQPFELNWIHDSLFVNSQNFKTIIPRRFTLLQQIVQFFLFPC